MGRGKTGAFAGVDLAFGDHLREMLRGRMVLVLGGHCCPILARGGSFAERSEMPTTISAMQVVDETLIAEAGRRLAAAAPDAQVILFGSHARGEASPGSDIDFLVVEPEVHNEAEESVRLHRTLRDLRVPADVIVISRDYAERWREVRGGLVHAALSQGRVLAG
jgi:predicted nucleotidyltransferase